MRKILTSLVLGTSLLSISHVASAKSSTGYNSEITSLPANTIRIEVQLSEDLEQRATGLPDGKTTCSSSRRLNSGFACNGFIGERDLNNLASKLEKWTSRSLTKKGMTISDEAGTVLKLTLVDAKNNRPTFRQLSEQTGLSLRSIGLGGAEVSGEILAADGSSLGVLSYSYYDTFFDNFTQSAGIWTDANHAIQRFSRRVAKDMASHAPQSGS